VRGPGCEGTWLTVGPSLRFAGAHVRSAGAIRTFWFFMLISIAVDLLWLFVYSPLRPIAWDTILSLSRKDQVRPRSLAARSPSRRVLSAYMFMF
jgi:hypothetical protein